MRQTLKNRLFILAMIAFGLGFTSCGDDYDDTWVRETTADLEERVAALEEWQKNVNAQISSLQSIVANLEKKDYVTNVALLADGTGYVISFQNSGDVTILNGKNGDSPVIGVNQDTDEKYYWTLNGEWLMDGDKKMPVTGEKGDKGDEGDKGDNGEKGDDAIAPKVRINKQTSMWEISTDGGNTWTSTKVKATGEKGDTGDDGDSMFSDIDVSNSEYVVLTLADGTTTITLPRYQGSFLRFHYDYGHSMKYVVPGSTTFWRFYYPENLTEDKFDNAWVTIMPCSEIKRTRVESSGWRISSISGPVFHEDGTLDTSKEYEVEFYVEGGLESYDDAVLTIYLIYQNGKQETTSGFCSVYGPS